jgi:RNA polymerase sigma-70 factor (ECF subfamily)
MAEVLPDSTETHDLLQQARAGDRRSFDCLFERHRAFLEQRLAGRLDPKLRPRLDPSDVVQEAHLEAYRRFADYLQRQPMPFRLWLWKTAYERLLNLRRDHVEAARRAVTREVPLPEHSSEQLALRLVAGGPTPSDELTRRERAQGLRRALAQLAEDDREVLLLRYVDNLSNQEAAQVLEISPGAASKRHGRAILRLHQILAAMGLGGPPR